MVVKIEAGPTILTTCFPAIDLCFEHHATEDVKIAVDGIGEYHKFMIAMAFKEEGDQV